MGNLTPAPELIDPSASPEPDEIDASTDETTPEPNDDGQPVVEEAKPEVKTYEIDFGDGPVQATAEEIAQWRTDHTNMSAMSASATQKYQEAARLREETEARLNDPEFQRLKNIDTMLKEHPETLEEFQRLAAYVEGRGPRIPQYPGQQMPNPINTQLAYKATVLERKLQEQEQAQRKAEVLSQVEAFRAEHESVTDEQFGIMYDAMKNEVAPEVMNSPNFKDVLDFYYFKHFGEVASKVAVAEARREGAAEAVKKVVAGKSVGGVTPTGHVHHDWTPPKDSQGLSASYEAALKDGKIKFDGVG